MLDAVLKYWPVVVVAGSFVSAWVSWSAKKHFVSHADLGAVRKDMGTRIGGVADRVSRLEKDVAVISTRLDGIPNKEDLHRIEALVLNVAGDLQGVSASQKGIERQLHLIMRSKIE